MSLKEKQKIVDDWMSQFTEGYWSPHEIICRLSEETGELAREINHRFGPKRKKDTEDVVEVGDEISDIIFTLICLANSLDIDMEKYFEKMMEKYQVRDKNRWKRK